MKTTEELMAEVKAEMDERERLKREQEEKEAAMREAIKREIMAEIELREYQHKEEEENYFVEAYIQHNRISQEVVDRLNKGDTDGLHHYSKDIQFLEEAWQMYKANDKRYAEREHKHVAQKLGLLPLELRIELMQQEGKIKI